MTTIDSFYRKECEKIDAQCVDVELGLSLNLLDNSKLILENPWGDKEIDLGPAMKDAETTTHLKLSPADNPTYLQFDNEDGEHECIAGDDLSKIISLSKLKDVTPATTIPDGYGYVWDAVTNKFKLFDIKGIGGGGSALEARVAALETTVSTFNTRITALESAITTLNSRITTLQETLTKPSNIPTDATVAWSNVNVYTQTDKSTGAFVHDPATAVTGDRTVNSDVS